MNDLCGGAYNPPIIGLPSDRTVLLPFATERRRFAELDTGKLIIGCYFGA